MSPKMILISTTFALMASTALAQTSKEAIVEELTQEGFTRIVISLTLFRNTRIEATGDGIEREIVLGKEGTVLRDRTERDKDNDDDDDGNEEENDDNNNERDNDRGGENDNGDDGEGEGDSNNGGGGESDSDGDSDSDGESGGDGDGDSEGNAG